jgi:hypothetical protein
MERATADDSVLSDGATAATADDPDRRIEDSWTGTRSGIDVGQEQPLQDGNGDDAGDEEWFYDNANDEEEALLEEELTAYSESVARVDDEGWFYGDDISHERNHD